MWLSLARAPGLGPGGRRFESCHPDLTETSVMQECRNWQTSKTKDLVADFAVWVQVPSPALKKTQTNVWVFFNAEESLEPKVQGLLDQRSSSVGSTGKRFTESFS